MPPEPAGKLGIIAREAEAMVVTYARASANSRQQDGLALGQPMATGRPPEGSPARFRLPPDPAQAEAQPSGASGEPGSGPVPESNSRGHPVDIGATTPK